MQRVRVRSLVGELRYHMPRGVVRKKVQEHVSSLR